MKSGCVLVRNANYTPTDSVKGHRPYPSIAKTPNEREHIAISLFLAKNLNLHCKEENMNHYTCPRCGLIAHSAAIEADMVNNSCPYCGHNEAAPVSKTETAKGKNTIVNYTPAPVLSSIFVCDNCGATFDEPTTVTEYHGFREGPGEEFSASPCCHYSYHPGFNCAQCDALISEEQSLYGLCAKCEADALDRFKCFLANAFTDSERAYLDACVEGESIIDPERIKPVLAC